MAKKTIIKSRSAISARLSRQKNADLRAHCARSGQSISQVIESAVISYLASPQSEAAA